MWQGYYKAIFWQLFIPYIFYFFAFICYATAFAEADKEVISVTYGLKWFCLVVWGKFFITFMLLELIQFRGDPCGYFTDFWNIIDFTSLVLCATYIGLELTGNKGNDVNVLGSVSCLLLWTKLFYWMRIFKPFSAFIRIITEIIMDIRVFSVMLIFCLAAFANVLMILDNNRELEEEKNITPFTGQIIFDAMIHAYLTGLGDFNKDNYSIADDVIVWIMFLLATFLVQLVFMNMLIAIMGESFGRITAIQEQSTLKEICGMIDDCHWLLEISDVFKSNRYILWLTPASTDKSGTVVERMIGQLQDFVGERADETDAKLLRQIALVDEKVTALAAAEEGEESGSDDDHDHDVSEVADQVHTLTRNFSKMQKSIDSIKKLVESGGKGGKKSKAKDDDDDESDGGSDY